MQELQTDRLGRATFHHIRQQVGVRPTARELRWFKHIERHGPQSSQFLYDLTRDTHRCRDTALRAMQKLRAGGFLTLPRQQRQTAQADFNAYIYDLTKTARDYLTYQGLAEPTIRPTGHWWHAYLTACATSAIDIAAAREGVRYIAAHTILARSGASIAIPVGRERLIPDQLFALDYGGSYRAFLLEVDRGTEPIASPARRKSLARSVELYRQLITKQLHKSHYGLKANLLALFVFTTPGREAKFAELLAGLEPTIRGSMLLTTVVEGRDYCVTDRGWNDLYSDAWRRVGLEEVNIGK